jgi:hypothetical protein
MPLPTEKTAAQPKMGKVFIYAEPKIGKSLLSMMLDPEHTIALDVEDGLSHIEGYKHRIRSWGDGQVVPVGRTTELKLYEDSFRGAIMMLHQEDHPFKIATVDTADALAGLCSEYVLKALGQSNDQVGYVHASDFDYGKGWDAINKEWQLRIGALCRVMDSVILISHADRKTKRDRVGAEYPVYTPSLGPSGIRKWTLGYSDHIIFMDVENDDQGEPQRVLHTQPTASWEAGGRTVMGGNRLPDPLWLPDAETAGATLRAALEGVLTVPKRPAVRDESKPKSKPKAKAKPAAEEPTAQGELGEAA